MSLAGWSGIHKMKMLTKNYTSFHGVATSETQIVIHENLVSYDKSLNGTDVVLCIVTRKSGRKTLLTTADVRFASKDCMTSRLFQDFNKTVLETPMARVTKKAIVEQHEKVLESVESIVAEAKAFYIL